MNNHLICKLFPFLFWKPLLTADNIRADLIAGITGAIIVLPQGVAFAMIAGLPPQYGLYTAMVTPVIAALFGSSRHLVSGPTTAISIVVFSTISRHAEPGTPEFIQLVLTLTFLAGIYQMGFGLARLGALINFVSPSVVTGFTSGAAILIGTNQMKHVLGIPVAKGETFINTWITVFNGIGSTNFYVLAIAVATLITAIILKKLSPKAPVMLVAMVAGSVLNILLDGSSHGVMVVGEISAFLPPLSTPDLSLGTIKQLAPEAFAVGLLGLIEAVSISRSVAVHSHQRIDGNQEFIGQGLSNIVGSFFSSYAGSGSFTRTGVNYQVGAKTPLSAIFAAVFLLFAIIFIAPLAAYLPIASMGAIILIVAFNLIETHSIKMIFSVSRSETAVLITTFVATLLLNLEFAIYAGVILSLFFYLNRAAKPRVTYLAPDPLHSKRKLKDISEGDFLDCPQLKIMRIEGPLFFGAINHIVEILQNNYENGFHYKHFLIEASRINFVDIASAEMLMQEAKRLRETGGSISFLGLTGEVEKLLKQPCFEEGIDKSNMFTSTTRAIREISKTLDAEKCLLCYKNVFRECRSFHE